MKIYHTEYRRDDRREGYNLTIEIENSYIYIDIYSRKVVEIEIYDENYSLGEFKVGSEMTTELCEKYDLLDVDDVDTGEIYYYPEKGFMHAEFCVNPEDVISKINKITFSIDVEIPSENNVEDALKAKKIEDIYYSLYNFGEIEIEIENKEIIGKLEGSIFKFDLLSGNLKNIEIKK
ncbi:hypothetical protein AMK43_00745 [Leptotrichia sp. oral taxon 212]|nr:hypothetical protein AMK43_00745 [Leptotrichia sp. oral taxon 212]